MKKWFFLAGLTLMASCRQVPPTVPDNVADMRQMQAQVGALPLTGLPPHREDPYRPNNVIPTDSSYKYWTDTEAFGPASPAGYHIKRSQWGEWTDFRLNPDGSDEYSPLDPLVFDNGKPVAGLRQWERRRAPGIWRYSQREVWGIIPRAASRLRVKWQDEVAETDTFALADGRLVPYITRTMIGLVDTARYPGIAHQPALRMKFYQPVANQPIPLIVQLGQSIERPASRLCLEECFSRGWGYLVYDCGALQPDNGRYLTDYLIGLVNKGQWRRPQDWGAMAAWSWGLSRLIDHLEQDPSVDAAKIGVTGHSRYGKTALLAMNYEPRLAIAYVSCSGVLGAAPIRTNWGENLEVISSEGSYLWVAGNVFKWVGPAKEGQYHPRRREYLKTDAHFILALAAPRPVFIGAGTTDSWANPLGMWATCRRATPVYDLYGVPGLVTDDSLPQADKDYIDGTIGFRLHRGGHNDAQDWPAFARFAERYLGTTR